MNAILTYHSIDPSGSPISIAPEAFRRHHQWLTGGSVRVLPLDELMRDTGIDRAVAVTFDDGFLNVQEPIASLLAEGVPVTVFAVTGRVGGTNAWGGRPARGIPTLPLMNWDHLEQLRALGAGIGAHTRSHPSLPALAAQELADELLGAREDIERRLGVSPPHVAYPYGDVDERVAARAGEYFRWGCTTELGPLTGRESPLELPRLDMYYYREPGALDAWGSPGFLRRVRWLRTRRRLRALVVGPRRRGATRGGAQ